MGDQAPSVIPSYIATILRGLLASVGGYLAGKGYITADQAPEIAGAIMTVAVVVWGIIQKAGAHAALKSAIAAPAGQA